MAVMKKVIPLNLTEEEIEQINDALDLVTTKLKPFLISLSPKERQAISLKQIATSYFLENTSDYMERMPELAPKFLNKQEFDLHRKSSETLMSFYFKVVTLQEELKDTRLMTLDVLYHWALAFYNNVKQAIKQDIPGAKIVHEQLKVGFEVKKNKKKEDPPEE